MTKDDIMRMAREAGSIDSEEVIETVWNAFSAAEREACADIVENAYTPDCGGWTAQGIADAIRARTTP